MLAKKHKSREGRIILAVCDGGLIRKKFVEGDLQIDLTGNFYNGEEKTEDEVKKMLADVNIINAVGEKCVAFLEKLKLVDKKKIIKIAGVPHAEVIIVRE
jgi:hypothetical protein